jgi:hypothetical protein
MIEFRKYGQYIFEEHGMPDMKHALLNCTNLNESYYLWLNILYNNKEHFFNSKYEYDTWEFLKEISMIANSLTDKLVILGGIHQDTGHQSGVITYKTNNAYANTYAYDSYIRFKVELKNPRRLQVLNEIHIFHFLVDVPQINVPAFVRYGDILINNLQNNLDIAKTYQMYFPMVNRQLNLH